MKKRIRKRVCITFAVVILIAVSLAVSIMYFSKSFTKDEAENAPEITDSFDIIGEPEEVVVEKNHTELAAPVYSEDHLPSSTDIDVKVVYQMPELPTGCEITSLTEVLNFLGYPVEKTDLADNYLEMDDEIKKGAFMQYYVGSPYDPEACGCFSPALIKAANSYLEDQKSAYAAYSLSYKSIESLFAEVANGSPVIVWTSLDYSVTDIERQTVYIPGTGEFHWPVLEHCVVLTGYDLDKKTVTFADPMYGKITHSIDDFSYYLEIYFYQAMVIR